MKDGNIENGTASRPEWEHLEERLRGQMQGLIQDLLEQEVTEFLGRARSVRRSWRTFTTCGSCRCCTSS